MAILRSSARDVLSNPFARQAPRFAPDITFFDSHIIPMMKDTSTLMIVISALMPLIIALLFHVTAVMPVITALMIVVIAVMFLIIRVMFVMIALTTDITGVMSIIIRIMWLVIGMTWLTKKVMPVIMATMTEPDRPIDRSASRPERHRRRLGTERGRLIQRAHFRRRLLRACRERAMSTGIASRNAGAVSRTRSWQRPVEVGYAGRMNDQFEALADRVSQLEAKNTRLERQAAWLKSAGAFGVVALMSVAVLMGAAAPTPSTVEAKRFVVKDDNGNVRAFMDAAQGHGRIWLYDENNVTRVFVGASSTTPGLQVNSAANKPEIKVMEEASGPVIGTYDPAGKETFKKP